MIELGFLIPTANGARFVVFSHGQRVSPPGPSGQWRLHGGFLTRAELRIKDPSEQPDERLLLVCRLV